jgi:hypothetical protein
MVDVDAHDAGVGEVTVEIVDAEIIAGRRRGRAGGPPAGCAGTACGLAPAGVDANDWLDVNSRSAAARERLDRLRTSAGGGLTSGSGSTGRGRAAGRSGILLGCFLKNEKTMTTPHTVHEF